jgi:hypothetical protein
LWRKAERGPQDSRKQPLLRVPTSCKKITKGKEEKEEGGTYGVAVRMQTQEDPRKEKWPETSTGLFTETRLTSVINTDPTCQCEGQ